MKKFSNDSFYPFIIIGLVIGGLHFILTSMFDINRNFAFFGSIVAALLVYALIVERKE